MIDIAAIEKLIAQTAAEEIMPRFRKLQEGDVEMKGADDPVTVADKAAEKALSAHLTQALPESVVIGEESHAADPSIFSRFDGDAPVWVIDPIDGTRHFIEGHPEFGVMVALVRRGETLAAWIHDPSTGDTLTAERGSGVWLRGKKMRMTGQDDKSASIGVIGSRLRKKLAHPDLKTVCENLPAYELGSAVAFDYGRFFTGDWVFAKSRAKRANFLLYRQSKPWDHMPGLLMVAEGGGHGATLRKRPYHPKTTQTGLLLAPDEELWDRIYSLLRPHIDVLLA